MPPQRLLNRFDCARLVAIASLALVMILLTADAASASNHREADRLWLVSTRHISSSASCVDLEDPRFDIRRIDPAGRTTKTDLHNYVSAVNEPRSVVIYVHGNRMKPHQALCRGLSVYKRCKAHQQTGPIDWVIYSWPSEQQGILAHDVREKARRTEAQGLYLAWLLRHHLQPSSTTLIGYSFGGRVVTGALHALAGGSLGRRTLPETTTNGMAFGVGLIAPAIDRNWLTERGYHKRATTNMSRLVLLYNHRDIVLKRYWLIDRVRGRMALGYSGPTAFGPRADGSRLPVRARDCARVIGLAHVELDYYEKGCQAGSEMAALIDDL